MECRSKHFRRNRFRSSADTIWWHRLFDALAGEVTPRWPMSSSCRTSANGFNRMSSPTGQEQSQVESDQLAGIENAVKELAKSLRTIKIVLIFYVSVTLLVTIGSTVWTMSGQLTRTIRQQLESARPASSSEQSRPNSPQQGDPQPTTNPPDSGGESGSPVFRVGNGITSPRLLSKIEPGYSEEARAAKLEGTVLLAVEVWEDGTAHNVRVVRSLGLGLDENAIDAVKKWKFSPGTKDGKRVRVSARVEVKFRLL